MIQLLARRAGLAGLCDVPLGAYAEEIEILDRRRSKVCWVRSANAIHRIAPAELRLACKDAVVWVALQTVEQRVFTFDVIGGH